MLVLIHPCIHPSICFLLLIQFRITLDWTEVKVSSAMFTGHAQECNIITLSTHSVQTRHKLKINKKSENYDY